MHPHRSAVSGSSQLVIQVVSIHAHHTASIRTAGLQRAERREMLEQPVRELRDREHEHQVEEQFDEGDAMMLVAAAALAGGWRLPRTCGTPRGYLIASGLVGEPTAPVIGIAGATNRNS